jgi:hypothetical protein
MSNLVKKDPAYELIKEMINGALFERGPLIGKKGQITKTGQKVLDITDLSSITDLPISELGWTKLANPEEGEINEVGDNQRKQLEEYLRNIQGNDLRTKIEYINKLYNMTPEEIETSDLFGSSQADRIQSILAYLVFMKTLTTIITNFNAAAAGFVFEAFLGVLLGGAQVPTNSGTIADLRTSDGTPVSLKLYSEKGVHVGGSYTDLVGDMINPKTNKDFVQYIVAVKSLQGEKLGLTGSIKIYQFSINLENIFNALSITSKHSRKCIMLPEQYIQTRGKKSVGSVHQLPTEELYGFFLENYNNLIEEFDTSENATSFINDVIAPVLDNAANDSEYMFGGKAANIGYGYSKMTQKACLEFLKKINKERGILTPEEEKELIPVAKVIAVSLDRAIELRKQYQKKTFDKLTKTKWATPEQSVEFYNSLNPEEKKKALLNSYGHIFTEQFGMTFEMMMDIIRTIPQADGAEMGTIVIGRAKIIDVIKKMALVLGQNVVEIFNSLKTLNTSLNTYFATGLTDDQAAEAAQQSATKINRKTTELRKKGI